MPWTQLFKVSNFEQALQKRKKLFHIDPMIKGRGLHQVKKVFKMTELPFVWDEKEIMRENNPNSPYHRLPKGIFKREKEKYERLLKLRTGIQTAKEKELKYRQESLNKRSYKGMDRLIKLTMPFMIKQSSIKISDGMAKSKGRKMVGQYVKDVPKVKNVNFGRRNQEKAKNFMEDEVLDVTEMQEVQKQKQRDIQLKREQDLKEQEAKKKQERTEKLEAINQRQQNTPFTPENKSNTNSANKKQESGSSSSDDE